MNDNKEISQQKKTDPLSLKRKLIQLYAALLYNAHLKGFTEGQIYTGPIKNVCVPGFNCYSCPGAIGACPLGALQNALASSTTRLPAYVFGTLILFGLLLGRTICGFICPLGLIQELLFKIPSPKLKKNKFTRALTWVKYVILGVFVVLIPLYFALDHLPLPAFCKYICPAGTLEGAMGLLANPVNESKLSMLGILFTRKFVIMVVMILSAVFIYRVFCRFLCPLGAIYGFFCRVAMVGVHVDEQTCIDCSLCVRTCKMDVKRVGDHECIHCGDCIAGCPKKCISFRVGSKDFKLHKNIECISNEIRSKEMLSKNYFAEEIPTKKNLSKNDLPLEMRSKEMFFEEEFTDKKPANKAFACVSRVMAVLVLIGVMWYVNKPTGAAVEEIVETNVEVGKDVGMQLPDFTASVYGGETFDSTSARGKILVLNFWATWCTPCVAELPYFAQVAADYAEDVQVIAVHSSLVTEDVEAWINRENIPLTFALDESGAVIESLGGSTMLPMTVIVDANGMITYNAVGSLTNEKLQGLIKEAMKNS